MRYLLLVLLTSLSVGASAQMPDVQPGAKVRFSAPSVPDGVTGVVILRTADSIVVATPHTVQYRVAFSSLSKLSVSRGKSHARGAKKGFLWAAAVTLPITFVAVATTGSNDTGMHPAVFAVTVASSYGAWGALIGGAIGSEAWTKQTLPGAGNLSPSVGVAPGGVRAGGQFRFR